MVLGLSLRFRFWVPADGSLLVGQEDLKLGNGRSLAPGSTPARSEGSEPMEGAAAVGRQQVLCSRKRFHRLAFSRLGLLFSWALQSSS